MRMRVIRSLVFASVSVMSFFIILSTLTNTTPASPTALHTLVTHTHNHINHLQNNIKEEFESLVSSPDPEVLRKLGFVENPVLYPHTNWTNVTSPVIATAVSSNDLEDVANVLSVAAQVCPEANILIYTLDLSLKQTAKVESLCNDTCFVVPFEHASYPSHVRNWRLRAYRPIIIQELLVRAGAVLWLDPAIRLVVHSAQERGQRTSGNSSDIAPEVDLTGGQQAYLYSNRANHAPFMKEQGKLSSKSYSSSRLDHRDKSFVEFPDVSTNGSGLQAMYPNDQAALLHIANRYISVDAEASYHSDLLTDEAEVPDPGRNLLMVAADDALPGHQPVGLFSFTPGKDTAYGKSEAILKSSNSKQDPDLTDLKVSSLDVNSQANKKYLSKHSPADDQLVDKASANEDSRSSIVKFVGATSLDAASIAVPPPQQGVETSRAQVRALEKKIYSSKAGLAHYLRPPLNTSNGRDHAFEEPSAFGSLHLEEALREDCVLKEWRRLALNHRGVMTWQFSDPLMGHLPTAALTHPGMFAAMHTVKYLYDFHQMSDAGAVLLYNTEAVHERLMKPWLACSLVHHCVQPIGAQDTGCKYDKKPLFRYSGCHLYDASAFNVALGLMLGPHSHPYQPNTPVTFTRVPPTPLPTTDEQVLPYLNARNELKTSNSRLPHKALRSWPPPPSLPLSNHSIAGPTLKHPSAQS